MTLAQPRMLQIVGEKAGTMPQVLANQMCVRQALVTSLADKLTARGVVKPVSTKPERRQINVVMTI